MANLIAQQIDVKKSQILDLLTTGTAIGYAQSQEANDLLVKTPTPGFGEDLEAPAGYVTEIIRERIE